MKTNWEAAIIHNLELRHLRYVLAVAEELHFAKAAKRLNLAAPSLSKQIKQLENLLGYSLFERKTRRVLLTRAGSAFIAQAHEALNHVQLALNLGAAANDPSKIAIGYSPWTDLTWIMKVRALIYSEIGTTIVLRSEHTGLQVESLLNGRLSAGIAILPVQAKGLRSEVLRRERLMVALPASHQQAKSCALTFDTLAGEQFIATNGTAEPALNRYLFRLGEMCGFVPNVIHEVTHTLEALELVAANGGTALIRASSAAFLQTPGVVFCECTHPELFLEVGLMFCSEHLLPDVETLVDLLRNNARATP